MKVHPRVEIYCVTIALGFDLTNEVWSHTFLGPPTQEMILAYFDHVTDDLHGYVCDSGMPGGEHLAILHQCRWLVATFGLPSSGLGKECVSKYEHGEFRRGYLKGHIWIDLTGTSVTHVE